jgi:hypothetical protein
MSENTNPQGSVSVNEAASAFLSLMDSPTEEAQAQPEVDQQEQESEEVEYSAEAEDSSEDYTDESAEETEAEEEVTEEPQKFKVKVDNEEIEVTLEELQQGYSRTKDYTKKTQALAETRKAVEAEKARIEEAKQLRDTYAQRLQVIEQMLNQNPDNENLAELKESDPIGYAIKVAERAEREKQLQAVQAEKQRIAQQQQAEQQEYLKNHLASEAQKLKEWIPEFRDEVKADIARKEIKAYAKSIGFSDQELANVYDARAVQTLYKAMQYEKLMKGKTVATKKVTEAPKTLKSGASQPQGTSEQEAIKKQFQKLRQSGKKQDAAKLFEKFI